MIVADSQSEARAAATVTALAQRLRAAAVVLLARPPAPATDPAVDAANTLSALLDRLRETGRPDEMWLIYTAVSTVFPTEETVRAGLRFVRVHLDNPAAILSWVLETCLHATQSLGSPELEMDIIEGGVVVDVDFSAQHEHNTGIQRVVRNTVPRWAAQHPITLVAWLDRDAATRSLDARETARVLEWEDPSRHHLPSESGAARIIVPWRSVFVLSEVPSSAFVSDAIAAIGSISGNALTAIGYDAIPTVSADMVPWDMSDHFARYLTIVKSMTRLAGISSSAAAEFQGFVDMLGAQGVTGPLVVECELPGDVPEREAHQLTTGQPVVLVVGSKEPRKNQDAVLYAAERLWRDGLDFELEFVGTFGWNTIEFKKWVRRLRHARRHLTVPQKVTDSGLWAAYERASFMVFPSLHEGYGLPVVEALAHGTPVITSDYGSLAEIAAGGGCLVVDPRDDEQLVDAMRALLTDGNLRARLVAEAVARPTKSWQDYADELWSALVEGLV